MNGGIRLDQNDLSMARKNPWGLTAYECAVLRLMCVYGSIKAVWAATEVSSRTIEHHLGHARRKMSLPGRDIRVFTQWHDWSRHQSMRVPHYPLTTKGCE